MKKILFFMILILSFCTTSFAASDDEYIDRAVKLGVLKSASDSSKQLSRVESVIWLANTINFEKFEKQYPIISFKDTSKMSKYATNSINTLFEYGIILKSDYPNEFFMPEKPITHYEFNRMIERIYRLGKRFDILYQTEPIFASGVSDDNSFDKLTQKEAAIAIVKLIDEVYYGQTYGIDLIDPINGHYYTNYFNVQISTLASKHISETKIFVNNKCVKTIEGYEENITLEISKYKPDIYEFYVSALTKDGVTLNSVPIRVNFNKKWEYHSFIPPEQSGLDILAKVVKPTDFNALTNNLRIKSTDEKRLLFLSDSPEELKNASSNLLFDSKIQSQNFRLLVYHQNNLSVNSSVYFKVEIENLGAETLDISEHGGIGQGVNGNLAGYYSTRNYFSSYDKEAGTSSLRIRNFKIDPYSKQTLLLSLAKPKNVFSYLGDFDLATKGFYRLKVYYYVNESEIKDSLSDIDNKHVRGIFTNCNYTVDMDRPNVCFQLGTNKKKYSSEANVNEKSYGLRDGNIILANDGHFGEVFNINITNGEYKPLVIAIEFRGTVKTYPNYLVFRDNNGKTKGFGVNSDYALYSGKQVIIARTNQINYSFSLTVPAGANAPIYVYVMEGS
jgi:hypothetical protein